MNCPFPRTHWVTCVRGTPQTGHLPQGQALLNPGSFFHGSKEDTGEQEKQGPLLGSGRCGGGDIPGLGLGTGRAKSPQSRNRAVPASIPAPIPGSFLQHPLPCPCPWETEHQELTSRTLQDHSLECKIQTSASPQWAIWGAQCILPTRIK